MFITENMRWPPSGPLDWKMAEHSAWYSGDPDILANFYTEYANKNFLNLPYAGKSNDLFWGRQFSNQGEIFVHVPIAGDIAETSANFLFGESPVIKIAEAHEKEAAQSAKDTQSTVDTMLMESGFYRRILEGAETCAGIGGVFIKVAWDEEVSPYPVPVVVQADRAIPEFKFGIMTACTFWQVLDIDKNGTVVWRLLERYERGLITTTLWKGSQDKLGFEMNLTVHPLCEDMEPVQATVNEMLAFYIPNKLPNRIDRNSYLGRSDYSGIEGLMDSLDEVYSSWVKDIAISQGKIHVPESFMQQTTNGKGMRYNLDQTVYVKLDMDPTIEGKSLTATQFAIRANEFEKSALNLMDRIISSAGYSPQSFGLSIEGRAESGTALSIRERKSFATKSKKEDYWHTALCGIIKAMALVYYTELGGKLDINLTPNVSFSDGITNNLSELAMSVKMISDAQAASTATKVRLLHPEWEEDQVQEEATKIIEENGLVQAPDPDMGKIEY